MKNIWKTTFGTYQEISKPICLNYITLDQVQTWEKLVTKYGNSSNNINNHNHNMRNPGGNYNSF